MPPHNCLCAGSDFLFKMAANSGGPSHELNAARCRSDGVVVCRYFERDSITVLGRCPSAEQLGKLSGPCNDAPLNTK